MSKNEGWAGNGRERDHREHRMDGFNDDGNNREYRRISSYCVQSADAVYPVNRVVVPNANTSVDFREFTIRRYAGAYKKVSDYWYGMTRHSVRVPFSGWRRPPPSLTPSFGKSYLAKGPKPYTAFIRTEDLLKGSRE
jgi:hypothetical protein